MNVFIVFKKNRMLGDEPVVVSVVRTQIAAKVLVLLNNKGEFESWIEEAELND